MTDLLEVKLELLRAGPAHNQLLSPLTPYLALCGDGGPATFHIKLEHRELLHRLERLRYYYVDEESRHVVALDNRMRQAEIEELGRFVGNLLREIETLSPELSRLQPSEGAGIHMRLSLAGSELSLLPFELAISPQGFPGEGLPMLLQERVPITLTREVRRARPLPISWDRPPRILFISSAPGSLTVPTKEHLHAIRSAIEPWVRWESSGNQRIEHVKKIIKVVTNASLQHIRQLCANDCYTHVHILAHGASFELAGGEKRYGLALCDEYEPSIMEVVSGERLAQALMATRSDSCDCSRPSVVSLMTCDSGNQASILSTGGSLAHDLHAFGIPWVFASQFPLTKTGSIRVAQALYEALLRGDDPRCIMRDLRNLLRASSGKDHDWASLVVYADLPFDFQHQVFGFRDRQRRKAADVAFDRADRADVNTEEGKKIMDEAIEEVRDRLEDWENELPTGESYAERALQAECYGMRGAMEKRLSLLLHKRGLKDDADLALKTARDYYAKAVKREMKNHWTGSQYISLSTILGDPADEEWWVLTRNAAQLDLESTSPETIAWAHGTLAELEMLEAGRQKKPDKRAITRNVTHHCRKIVELMGEKSFHVFSTRRQFTRYLEYWKDERWKSVATAAVEILNPAAAQGLRSELPPDRH